MSIKGSISPTLEGIMQPYFGGSPFNSEFFFVRDLNITGHDYFDLIEDIEKAFETDLTDFFVGANPQYVSNGCLGFLMGTPRKPVYRDVSIRELNDFLVNGKVL